MGQAAVLDAAPGGRELRIGVRLLIRESTRAIGPARPAKTRRDARPPD